MSTLEKINERVGANLATRRRELKLTQLGVAKKAGISRPSLANIEAGRQTINLYQIYKLSIALQVKEISELLPNIDVDIKLADKLKIDATSELKPAQIDEVNALVAALEVGN